MQNFFKSSYLIKNITQLIIQNSLYTIWAFEKVGIISRFENHSKGPAHKALHFYQTGDGANNHIDHAVAKLVNVHFGQARLLQRRHLFQPFFFLQQKA